MTLTSPMMAVALTTTLGAVCPAGAGVVGCDRNQLATRGGRVGGLGPFGQLAEREPAFDGRHP